MRVKVLFSGFDSGVFEMRRSRMLSIFTHFIIHAAAQDCETIFATISSM